MDAPIHIDAAADFILDFLRRPADQWHLTYGYEYWLPNIVAAYLKEVEGSATRDPYGDPRGVLLSPVFYDAAWEFCRRGILRPGLRKMGGQAVDSGGSGDGYSLTEFGRKWLAESGASLPMAPGRLQEQFQKLAGPFGAGFLQRANEAALTYKLGAYLGCCGMCGAAAESVFLAVAIAKTGDEAAVLESYRAAQGRRNVLELVVGKARAAIGGPFRSAASLLSYWRDDAAHGGQSTISEIEAHEALSRLLRFAQFSRDNWGDLTKRD